MSSPPRRRPLRPDIRPAAAPPAAPPAAQMSGAEPPLPRVRLAIAAQLPTVGRRLLAWGLEVVVLTASIAIPFQLGRQVNDRVAAPQVDLTPPLQWVQTGTARALGLSPRSLPAQVTPLTNVFWSAALGLPLLLVAGHCYSLSRTGHSWPKRCLGLQVLALNGQMPGLRRTLLREAIGKWGAPLLLAYGVWQVSGAFPMVSLLVGFTAIALVGESLTSLGNRPRRAGHDWLAGTCVVDQETGAIIRLSSLWEAEAEAHGRGRAIAGPQAVVMPPRSDWSDPDLTLSKIGVGVGLLLTVGGLIGVGSYWWLERPLTRFANPDKTLYTHLVSTLTDPTLDPAARRAAVLALGNLPDDRVTPLLVDLIAQTDDVLWLDALQQALVARGPEAFPYLRRLNQSLVADLAMQGEPTLHRTLLIRLQTVNRIVAKLLLLEGGGGDRSGSLDLSRMGLGFITDGNGDWRLVLKHQNLAGIQWQGTVLTQAQLQGAKFYHPGADNHPNTYDDRTTDLSGADLTDANLSGADLSLSRLVNAGLLRTNLTAANLTLATLNGANLEQAKLIQANLLQAELGEARLSRADLTEADLTEATLTNARLAEVNAAGAKLIGANLQGITANAANLATADLSYATLENGDFTGSVLQGANLTGANLTQTSLRDADLRGVWLQGAVLNGTDFAGAILTATSPPGEGFVEAVPPLPQGNQFAQVDFSRARNLNPEHLTFICAQGGLHPTCEQPTAE